MSQLTIPKFNTRTEDLSGRTFGRLSVVEFSGFTDGEPRASLWLCLCACGGTRIVRGSRLTCGLIICCAKCAKSASAKRGGESRRLPATEVEPRRLFSEYRANAKRRGLTFSVSYEQARALFLTECAYCGTIPTVLECGGIDRIDNNYGYLIGNCAPCCSFCNFAKREASVSDFLEWVGRVYKRRGLR